MSPLDFLTDFLRIPSISTDPQFQSDCLRSANFLVNYFKSIGFDTRLLQGKSYPAVFAQYLTDNHHPTVLIYGHYDVQPPGAPSSWTTPAFEPSIRKGKIYARGATDNKGQLTIHLQAVKQLISKYGIQNLPINFKFYIEGEEEIGSPSVSLHLLQNPHLFSTDYIVLSDTEMLGPGQPSLDISLRGVMDLEISIQTGTHDVHSGQFGGLAPNPAFLLAHILTGIKNGQGKILIPGFYSDILSLSARQVEDMKKFVPNTKEIIKDGHFYFMGGGESHLSINRRRWYEPTLDITGLDSGYTGRGTKTIIPHLAQAKLSIRLVPNQDPYKIYNSLQQYLRSHLPKQAVSTISISDIAYPWRAPANHPIYRLAGNCLKSVFGCSPALVGQGGSIGFVPILARTMNVPIVLIGFGLPDENLHAPNEHFSLENLSLGILTMTQFYTKLSKISA